MGPTRAELQERRCEIKLHTESVAPNTEKEAVASEFRLTDSVSQEIPALQRQAGDSTAYISAALESGQTIDRKTIDPGEKAIRKLTEELHLCRIKEGILQISGDP